MPIPGSNDDGTMIADLAQFDLLNEIAEAEQQKPWASGIYSRTLFKKTDLRVVLISMEAAAQIKEHHADGTSSLYMLKGRITSAHVISRDVFVNVRFAKPESAPVSAPADPQGRARSRATPIPASSRRPCCTTWWRTPRAPSTTCAGHSAAG